MESENIRTSLKRQKLRTEARSILLGIVLERAQKEHIETRYSSKYSKMLKAYPDKCIREGDYGSLYGYFLVLNDIAAFSKEGSRYVLSLLDLELLIDVYVHCSQHHPVSTVSILELFDKLLPLIHDRDCHRLIDRLAVFYDFASRLSDRSMKI